MPLLNFETCSSPTILTQGFFCKRLLAALLTLALAACQTVAPSQMPIAETPAAAIAEPAAASGPRYLIDTAASEIRLLVYRDGPMARFGHNHVLQGAVRGELRVADGAAASSVRLEIPVDSFEIDNPQARLEEGAEFAAAVSDAARKGTRENLLGADLLDAANFPLIKIESDLLLGPRWGPTVNARITLRGKTSTLKFPAAVFQQGDQLQVVASFSLRQSDLGLTPFSVLGGAIRVADGMEVRVRLLARRVAN